MYSVEDDGIYKATHQLLSDPLTLDEAHWDNKRKVCGEGGRGREGGGGGGGGGGEGGKGGGGGKGGRGEGDRVEGETEEVSMVD